MTPIDPLENWSWDDLLDFCAGMILKDLIAGNFRIGVAGALDLAIRWRSAIEKAKQEARETDAAAFVSAHAAG